MSASDVHAFPVVSVPPVVGEHAPDFRLKDQHGQKISLSDFHGDKNVVLVFYPFAFSGLCTGELCEIRDNLAAFENDDVQVLAISVDHMFTQRAWSESQGYEFPVLSDYWPHGEVARAYGVFDEQGGFALRGTFLIDTEGTVRWSLVNKVGEARDFGGYHAALKTLVQR